VNVKVKEVREWEGMAPEAWGPTELGIYVYVYEIIGFFRSRSCRDAGLCVLGKIGIRGGRLSLLRARLRRLVDNRPYQVGVLNHPKLFYRRDAETRRGCFVEIGDRRWEIGRFVNVNVNVKVKV